MTRALVILGLAYRLRRCHRLLRAGRFAERGRIQVAIERDIARLKPPVSA